MTLMAVLVYGHWGRTSDRVFRTIGLLLVVVGTAIAAAGH
jgi:glucose uptake protein GlcU